MLLFRWCIIATHSATTISVTIQCKQTDYSTIKGRFIFNLISQRQFITIVGSRNLTHWSLWDVAVCYKCIPEINFSDSYFQRYDHHVYSQETKLMINEHWLWHGAYGHQAITWKNVDHVWWFYGIIKEQWVSHMSSFLFLFLNSKTERGIRIWSVISIFIFHSHQQKRKKKQKNNLFCICRPVLSRLVSFSWENK